MIGSWIPGVGTWWRHRVRRLWIHMILFTLGIYIRWEGRIPAHPAIYVGNHRAYLDPLLLMREVLAVPVAKKEMASWPLIGFASRLSGIFLSIGESPKDPAEDPPQDDRCRACRGVYPPLSGRHHARWPGSASLQKRGLSCRCRRGGAYRPVCT
ncbi:MAG: 1-acyl-sn-glycerol-3-phosphate acyltransferase [Saprospiraceae bacterium]|nr:1-acyl-sn-glycerol-3-phosphate acyltransferase [Saprospiraceae bacterium]